MTHAPLPTTPRLCEQSNSTVPNPTLGVDATSMRKGFLESRRSNRRGTIYTSDNSITNQHTAMVLEKVKNIWQMPIKVRVDNNLTSRIDIPKALILLFITLEAILREMGQKLNIAHLVCRGYQALVDTATIGVSATDE